MQNIIIAVATTTTSTPETVKYEDHLKLQYQSFAPVSSTYLIQSHLEGMENYQAGDCLEGGVVRWYGGCGYNFTSQYWAERREIFRGCCPEPAPAPASPLYNLRIALNKCTYPPAPPVKVSRLQRFLRWFMI